MKTKNKYSVIFNYNFLIIIISIIIFNINNSAFSQVAPVISPSGGFHIDGGLISNTPASGIGDWVQGIGTGGYIFNNNGSALDISKSQLMKDAFDDASDFTFSASKFNDNPNTWSWANAKASSKTDINNVMFHITSDVNNNTWLLVGGDRLSTNGTSYIDFEFLQNTLVRNPVSGFTSSGPDGGRTVNDIVISMEYSNGGSNANVHFYFWKPNGTGFKYIEQFLPSSVTFAITNTSNESVPFGAFGSNTYSPYQFVEAAINITALLGYVEPCIGISVNSLLVKTKSSDSETAALGDFVGPIPVKINFGTATISYNNNLCQIGTANVNFNGITGGSFSSSPSGLSINSSTGQINLGQSAIGTYTVTYSYITNSCPKTVSTTVTINPLPTEPISATSDRNIVCYNDNGNIILSVSGGSGSSLSWFSGSCGGQLIGTGNNLSIPSPETTTTYFARWENDCGISSCASFTVNVSSLLTASATGSSQVSCNNASDGEIIVTANGGTGAYSYSLNGGAVQSSNVFSGLVAGTYSVEVFDVNGCSVITNSVVIANPELLVASATGSAQVSCNNANDGEIIVTATGGTGVYSYSLNGGVIQSSNVFSSLPSGTYSVEIFDVNGCSVITNSVVIANPELLVASASGSAQVSCNNASDGEIIVTATGGTGVYSYSLNGGAVQSSNVFSSLPYGTYSVEVFDVNGCSVITNSVVIANPELLVASASGSAQVSCNNANDGEIIVTATGGTGVYSYSLNGGVIQSSNVFSSLPSGTYSVEIFDVNGCSVITNSVVIANPELLVASASGSAQVSCNNASDGEIIVTATGGTGVYSYSLNGGAVQSSNVFSSLPYGTYSVEVFDVNGCSVITNSVVIANPELLVASATGSSQASCNNANDGEIIVTATGGTGSYSYSLNGGSVQSSNVFSGLVAGTYSVEVFDVNGCSVITNSVVIANPELLVASASGSSQVSCNNASDGEIIVTATGGTGSYSYSLNGGTVQSSNVFSGLIAGTYSVEIFDVNGCSVITNSVVIANPDLLVASASGSSQVSCNNASDGEIIVTATGGTGSYSYSLNGGAVQSSNVFSGLIAGTYSVEIFDVNGCSVITNSVVIANPDLLVASATGSAQVSCNNANDGEIIVTATGGTGAYSYSLNGGAVQSSNVFSGLIPGTYSVEVFDVNGCSVITNSVVIANPELLVASASGSAQVSCNNANDGEIIVTATGGTGAYSYSLNGGAVQSSNVFSGLIAGTYSVEVFDLNGCSVITNSVVIANPELLVASASGSAQVSCNNASDGEIIVTATGGTGVYSYTLNGGQAQNSNVFSGLTAGTYEIMVSDANKCVAAANSVVIANPELLVASATGSAQVSCNNASDGEIIVTATGGTGAYSYSLNGGTVQSSNVFSGLIAGTYSVEIFDVNGCSVITNSVVIANPELLVASASGSAQVSCNNASDGEIIVTASGGTGVYSYTLNGGQAQNSNVFSGLSAGTYEIIVSDANKCIAVANSVVIANPELLVASASGSAQVSCNNASDGEIIVTATGGTGAYSYSLNGGTVQSSNVFSGLIAGTYSVEIFDVNGCSVITNSVVIANPELLVASASGSAQVSCNNASDGEIIVTATGGTGSYSYSLNGGTVQSSNVFSGLIAGTYSVEVFDVNGCSVITNSVLIANPELLVASASGSAQVSCNNASDGEIIVTATGGTGVYSYSLNGGAVQSSNVFSGLIAGTYSVEVFDLNGCSVITNSVLIANPDLLVASASGSAQVSCNNASDGEIIVTANGGTGAYSYSLNGGAVQSSNVFSGLIPGTYSVEVFDVNGCSVITNSVVIANPELLVASATGSSQASCNNASDGEIIVTATGGTGTYSYSLNGGAVQSSNVFSGLIAGTYSVEVFDLNGCSVITNSVVIANPELLVASATGSAQVSCNNASDGEIIVTATGGTGAYSYSLNGGAVQSSNVFSGLVAGTYSVEVFDLNGCSVITNSVVIANPELLVASATGSAQVSCNNASDGEIIVTAAGGTGTYSYSLNGGAVQSSNVFSGLVAGTYSVEVFDVNGCSVITNSVVIANPELLVATASGSSQVSCNNASDGEIIVTASGGTGVYSYSLNDGAVQTSNVFSGLVAGNYSVEVFDVNGCSVITNSIVINNKREVLFDATQSFIGCNGSNSGIISINVSSGVYPYSYSIDGGISYYSSNEFENLPVGVYSIIVKDAKNCISQKEELAIIEQEKIIASINLISENKCYGVNDAEVEIIALNAEQPTIYIIDNKEQNTNIVSNLSSGYHEIIVRDNNGCIASTDFNIESKEQIVIELISYSDANCVGKNDGSINVVAYGGTGQFEYNWSNGMSSNYIYGLDEGIYSLTVTDKNNCSTFFEKSVLPGKVENEVIVNNSFSPNGDGINDKWVIKNLELYPENQLVILNRWGNEIYTQNGYSNDWDGSNLAEGTYFYILNVNMCSGYKKHDGYITILR